MKKKINKELIKRLASTYEFCNKNFDKFTLLLRKGVYRYEYMQRFGKDLTKHHYLIKNLFIVV